MFITQVQKGHFCLQLGFLKRAYLCHNFLLLLFFLKFLPNTAQRCSEASCLSSTGGAVTGALGGAEATPPLLSAAEEGEMRPKIPNGNTKVQNTTSSRAERLASALQRRLWETPAFGEKETSTLLLSRGHTGRPGATPRRIPSPPMGSSSLISNSSVS